MSSSDRFHIELLYMYIYIYIIYIYIYCLNIAICVFVSKPAKHKPNNEQTPFEPTKSRIPQTGRGPFHRTPSPRETTPRPTQSTTADTRLGPWGRGDGSARRSPGPRTPGFRDDGSAPKWRLRLGSWRPQVGKVGKVKVFQVGKVRSR